MSALDDLSAFLAAPPPAYRAPQARERARMALVDLVGATIAGTREPLADMLRAHHAATGESGPCGLIGLAGSATACTAAFMNATIGHALDLDDSNFLLGGHPSVVIYPGILALAQAHSADGNAVLDAYTAGFEVTCRIAATVNLHHYEKGWHPTATLGVFGAAAAAAHLLALPRHQVVAALALAAASASGIKESFGSMAKPVQVGQAASGGVLAALLAQRGITAPSTALDGPQGFFAVYNGAGNFDVARLAVDPDEPELMRSGIKFKRYACCGSTHVAIDAALALRTQTGFDAGAITAVQLDVNPRRRPHVDRPRIAEPLGAKFSLQYTVSAALLDGAVGLDHFSQASVGRPDIAALMQRVTVGNLSDLPDLSQHCALRVILVDGQAFSVRLDGPQGRDVADYPAYMKQKFTDCAEQALSPEQAAHLYGLLNDSSGLRSVAALVRATVPTPESQRSRNGTHG